MPRSFIGFIVRSSSLAAASVAAVAIASASQQDVDVLHQATLRPATYEVIGPTSIDMRAGSNSSNAYAQDQPRSVRAKQVQGSSGLLAARDTVSGEQYASSSTDGQWRPEVQPVQPPHPVRLTSILATLALAAFYFLRRLI